MIVNRQYIIDRIAYFSSSEQDVCIQNLKKANQLAQIKFGLPIWIRKLFFHPCNPAYFIWKNYAYYKQGKKTDRTPYTRTPFVTDFITYCLQNDFSLDTAKFFTNQDDQIIAHIDARVKSFLTGFEKDKANEKQMQIRKEQNIAFKRKVKHKKNSYQLQEENNTFYLLQNDFDFHTFELKYGLIELSKESLISIEGKDILDIGAYHGASSVMFLQFNPRAIYAYEPVSANRAILLQNAKLNNAKRIIVEGKALGDVTSTMSISCNDMAATLVPQLQTANKVENVEVLRLDDECKNRNVGLIKMDVEGFEYNVIKGGLETIKRDRPILLISAYHTGKDFFEIMPLVHTVCPEYKFKYVDMEPTVAIAEKLIIGYV